MSGVQVNGCGAIDYFKKLKHLGDQECPTCKKVSAVYLERAKFKVSIFWIPTVTLKKRYAIMYEPCKHGKWIKDDEAQEILGENPGTPAVAAPNPPAASLPTCPNCGAPMEGAFCGKCGTKRAEPAVSPSPVPHTPAPQPAAHTAPVPVRSGVCYHCGAALDGPFCGACGAKQPEPTPVTRETPKRCANCGAELDGPFCGNCGAKYTPAAAPVTSAPMPSKPTCVNCGAVLEGHFCSRCGASAQPNPEPQSPLIISSNLKI